MRGLRCRLYFFLLVAVERIAPADIRAAHLEVLQLGLKAQRDARTIKTEDLPFMRGK